MNIIYTVGYHENWIEEHSRAMTETWLLSTKCIQLKIWCILLYNGWLDCKYISFQKQNKKTIEPLLMQKQWIRDEKKVVSWDFRHCFYVWGCPNNGLWPSGLVHNRKCILESFISCVTQGYKWKFMCHCTYSDLAKGHCSHYLRGIGYFPGWGTGHVDLICKLGLWQYKVITTLVYIKWKIIYICNIVCGNIVVSCTTELFCVLYNYMSYVVFYTLGPSSFAMYVE